MESSEPTYVATTIFATKQQFNSYINKNQAVTLVDASFTKDPESVFYEGTLMLSAPES